MKYKILKPVDSMASDWIREEVKGLKTYDAPQLSSAVVVAQNGRGKLVKDGIGYMFHSSNNVDQNSSGVALNTSGFTHGNGLSIIPESLGYFNFLANNIKQNASGNSILSSCYSNANGLSTIIGNIRKVVALFTARKTIKGNWINDKDEYSKPNTEHPEYQQWNNDCFVYSLFQSSSQQSSLRNIEYKGKDWDILNHFFFMSCEEIKELSR